MNDTPPVIVEDFRWLTPAQEQGWTPWLVLGLAVLVIAAALFFWLRRRKKAGLAFRRPPEPHEKALKALRELAGLIAEDREIEFVNRVSLVVREYIQDRFGLRAPHRSTEEFLLEARRSARLGGADQELLGGFLAQCDLVKFARQRVLVAGMQGLHDAARRFVEGTIPREPAGEAK
jgi:LPXTG-motif cell wall-anchored protein